MFPERIFPLLTFLICAAAAAAYTSIDECGRVLQTRTFVGQAPRAYVDAQPALRSLILSHPNGPAYLDGMNTDPARERVPTESELNERLTERERRVVSGYAGSLCRGINAYCAEPPGLFRRWRHRRDARNHDDLLRGLAKLDPFGGTVFRDDTVEDDAERTRYLTEGTQFTLRRFWSSSRIRTNQYGGDAAKWRREKDVTFVIRSVSGRSIEKIGWIFIDYEVLFAPGARFRVDLVFERVGGSHLVFLSELAGN